MLVITLPSSSGYSPVPDLTAFENASSMMLSVERRPTVSKSFIPLTTCLHSIALGGLP